MKDEVERFAKIALDDSKTWLWESGLAFFPGECQVERMVSWDMSKRNESYWKSEDSTRWDVKPKGFQVDMSIDGSSRGNAGKFAACGWVIAQMDLDRESEPWYGEAQRSSKRPEVCAVHVALCMLVSPTEINSDNRCVVQVKKKVKSIAALLGARMTTCGSAFGKRQRSQNGSMAIA